MKVIKKRQNNHLATIELIGGALALDFINTVDNRLIDNQKEYLDSPDSWLSWLENTQLKLENKNKVWTHSEINILIENRELIYKVVSDLVRKNHIKKKYLGLLNDKYKWLRENQEFHYLPEQKILHSQTNSRNLLDLYLVKIFRSFFQILEEDKIKNLKECEGCGWIFLDESKNKSRRWCSMKNCGNRFKAKKHYNKKKIS